MNPQNDIPFNKPTMSVPQVAKALGVGKNRVYEAVRAGRIPNVGLGKTIRIPTAWLVNLLDAWKTTHVGQ